MSYCIEKVAQRLIRTAKSIKKCVKDGGATQVNIAQLCHGDALSGRNVLITGGSRGIGLAIARKCLAEGANVVITGRNSDKLETVVQNADDTRLKALQWDVSEIDSADDKLSEVAELLGGEVDILVNNAGVLSIKPFLEVDAELWDKLYSVNSRGLFFLSQAVARRWIKQPRGGKILNISSSGGFLGAPHPYRMAKWDVVGLTRGLGTQLLPHGIIVNGIAPGLISTDMVGINSNSNAHLVDYPPSYRVGLPEEVAELALFLMSDAANYIVGQTIICDGGYSSRT